MVRERADDIGRVDEAARFSALSALREALPPAEGAGAAQASGLARTMTIAVADAFSLDLEGEGDAARLVPILHRAGGGTDERLLSDAAQAAFGSRHFNAFGTAKPVYPLGNGMYVVPCLATILKPHQEEGLTWLRESYRTGRPGVLLADDMGLGKTLQGLAFLAWLRDGMEAGIVPRAPVVVVAPTGLLQNWKAEEERHLHRPGLGRCLEAFGKGLAGLKLTSQNGRPGLDVAAIAQADWVLTTYETPRDYDRDFGGIRFAAMLFDDPSACSERSSSPTQESRRAGWPILDREQGDVGRVAAAEPHQILSDHGLADLRPAVDAKLEIRVGASKGDDQTRVIGTSLMIVQTEALLECSGRPQKRSVTRTSSAAVSRRAAHAEQRGMNRYLERDHERAAERYSRLPSKPGILRNLINSHTSVANAHQHQRASQSVIPARGAWMPSDRRAARQDREPRSGCSRH